MMFTPHPDCKKRKKSAVALIKYLLANHNPDVLPDHRKELIRRVLLYKLSEAECTNKFKTRFQSKEALGCDRTRTKLRHDHVYLRSNMVSQLVNPGRSTIDSILAKAIACTVTEDEHRKLAKFDKECDGWKRYIEAKIKVIDTKTGKRLV